MSKLKKCFKHDPFKVGDGKQFWASRSGHHYRSIVGGVCFPSAEPGFCVILGQDLHEHPQYKEPEIHVLYEKMESDHNELFESMFVASLDHDFLDWYGHNDNSVMFRLFCKSNKTPAGKQKIRLIPAPESSDNDAFGMYLTLIRSFIMPSKPLVRFGTESRLPDYLQEVSYDASLTDLYAYPAVTALGFALSALFIYEPNCVIKKHKYNSVPLDEVLGY